MNTLPDTTLLQDRIGLRAPLAFTAAVLLLFGLGYTLAGTAAGRLLFPAEATGSTLVADGRVPGLAMAIVQNGKVVDWLGQVSEAEYRG